jgi:hypothetical protein
MSQNVLLALVVGAFGLPAAASVVTSNDATCHAGTSRIFSVTANHALGCLLAGAGNINGNNLADAGFLAQGWAFVDASNDSSGAHNGWLALTGTLTSGLSGNFSIAAAAWSTYDRVAIGFKSGNGSSDPDWAIFELDDNTPGGSWAITGAQQGLSHAILYGRGTAPTPQPEVLPPAPNALVAEPSVLWLAALAMGGVAWRLRRRSEGKRAD